MAVVSLFTLGPQAKAAVNELDHALNGTDLSLAFSRRRPCCELIRTRRVPA